MELQYKSLNFMERLSLKKFKNVKLEPMRMIYYVCSMWALICLMRTSSASVIKDSVKCTEGLVAADIDDCASYFQCLDDEAVHINCPNGSYFEANNEVCVVDEFEICPTSTRKCFEGDLFVDFNDCAAYMICLRGNLVKEKCPLGSYFNIISKSCRLDRRAVCTRQREICKEGERTEDSKDCAGYLECARGALVKKKCPSGSYFEAIFKLCQVDEKGVCSTSSNHCSEGEVQVAPNNCAGYLTCQNGKLETKSCPNGSYFESTLKSCVVDGNGVCVGAPVRCTEEQVYLDPKNCAGYLKCIGGELVEEQCPSGTYYDFKLEACLPDSDGACVTNIKLCFEGFREKDPRDRSGYTQCIRGKVEYMKCDSGRYFNVTQQDCLIDAGEVCRKSEAVQHKIEVQHEYKESSVGDFHQNTGSTISDFHQNSESTVTEPNQYTESSVSDLHQYSESTVAELSQYTKNTVADQDQYTESTVAEITQYTESSIKDLLKFTESTVADLSQYTESIVADQDEYTESIVTELTQFTESTTADLYQFTESTVAELSQYTESTVLDLFQYTESTVADLSQYTENIGADLHQYTESTVAESNQYTESTVAHPDQYTESTVAEFNKFTESTTADLYQYTESTVAELSPYTESTVVDLFRYTESTVAELSQYTESIGPDLLQYTESTVAESSLYTESTVVDLFQYTESTVADLSQFTESTTADLYQYTESTFAALSQYTESIFADLYQYTESTVAESSQYTESTVADQDQYTDSTVAEFNQFTDSTTADLYQYTESTVAKLEQSTESTDLHQFTDGIVPELNQYTDIIKYAQSTVGHLPTTVPFLQVPTFDPLAKCTEGQQKLDPNNCAGYLKCINGTLKEQLCPSGFYFDSNLKACFVDSSAMCITNIKFCIEGVREQDPQDCAGYRQCIESQVQSRRCPSGSYFNVAERDCLVDEYKVCVKTEENSFTDLQSSDSDQQIFLSDKTCVLDVNGLCIESLPKCREGQLKLNPNNCAGYMKCIDGVLKERLCPSGAYYEPQLKACLVDRRGICVTNIEDCVEGLREEDPQDCAGYRQCIRGEVQNLKCPSGSYFSVPQRDCIVDVYEVCVNTGLKYYEYYSQHK